MFSINDKVVCINDDFSKSWDDPKKHFNNIPVKNKIYVIRKTKYAKNGEWMICLVGIESFDGTDGGFYHWRFRKPEELKNENKNKDKNICLKHSKFPVSYL